jgi:hypothetical protein
VYDWLLFLHVLAAFMLASTVVTYSAVVLGAPAGERAVFVANMMWDIGGLATLVLGIWLALDVDGYEVWDGWIIAAIVLWVVATGLGQEVRRAVGDGGDVTAGRAATMHWLRTLTILALLVLMIWKPGA